MTLTLTYDLDLQSPASYGHPQANVQGQRSVGSEEKVGTNGRTDGGDCITCRVNAVGKNLLQVALR